MCHCGTLQIARHSSSCKFQCLPERCCSLGDGTTSWHDEAIYRALLNPMQLHAQRVGRLRECSTVLCVLSYSCSHGPSKVLVQHQRLAIQRRIRMVFKQISNHFMSVVVTAPRVEQKTETIACLLANIRAAFELACGLQNESQLKAVFPIFLATHKAKQNATKNRMSSDL